MGRLNGMMTGEGLYEYEDRTSLNPFTIWPCPILNGWLKSETPGETIGPTAKATEGLQSAALPKF
jgi:hypothetical protein